MPDRATLRSYTIDAVAAAAGAGLLWSVSTPGTFLALVWIAVGVWLLIRGADYMVRGAARLAGLLGVSPFLIGLTVVAFGTSAPELAATIGATLKGEGALAIGNVVGSNIANLCLILPLTAMVSTIAVKREIVAVDVPLMIIVSIMASLPLLDGFFFRGDGGQVAEGTITRVEGLVLAVGLVAYVVYNARTGRVSPEEIEAEVELEIGERVGPEAAKLSGLAGNIFLTMLGLGGLVLGAELLVRGGVQTALSLGLSSATVGLTVVAIGTSIPELAFSVRAAQRGQADLALANVIGSNAFNLLSVLGLAALIDPLIVPVETGARDVWLMLLFSALVWPILAVRKKLGKPEAVILLVIYIAYVAFIVAPSVIGA